MKTTPEQLKRLVNEQHAVISRLRQALDAEVECSSTLREENARLREALRPFAQMAMQENMKDYDEAPDECVMTAGSWGKDPLLTFRLGNLRAARAAIREGGKDDAS